MVWSSGTFGDGGRPHLDRRCRRSRCSTSPLSAWSPVPAPASGRRRSSATGTAACRPRSARRTRRCRRRPGRRSPCSRGCRRPAGRRHVPPTTFTGTGRGGRRGGGGQPVRRCARLGGRRRRRGRGERASRSSAARRGRCSGSTRRTGCVSPPSAMTISTREHGQHDGGQASLTRRSLISRRSAALSGLTSATGGACGDAGDGLRAAQQGGDRADRVDAVGLLRVQGPLGQRGQRLRHRRPHLVGGQLAAEPGGCGRQDRAPRPPMAPADRVPTG